MARSKFLFATDLKIHEILLTEDETRHSVEFDKFFVVEPEHPFWTERHISGGKKLPKNFSYSSDNNKEWLDKKEIMKIIKEVEIE